MKVANIKEIRAREILDSRGYPTIEVDVLCDNGSYGRCSVPSGASTGSAEALELRDRDLRYLGKGVKKAVSNVNDIIKPKLIGMDVTLQKEIDELMIALDGTPNKSKLGANAILAVSVACLKAAAHSKGLPLYRYVGEGRTLPIPMMNIMNGGMHSNNNLDFQEFMIVPNRSTLAERLRVGAEVFHHLKDILKAKGYSVSVGDEGGFAPNLKGNLEALDYIVEAIIEAGYKPGIDVSLALDVAASSFYENGFYKLEGKLLTRENMMVFYENLINKYPIISIEDPLDESDFEGFGMLTSKIGHRIQIVGDDLFVTNINYLKKGFDYKACNAILIKLNQIGSYSEALATIELAKENGYKTIISHRSGETEDTFIADLAVGLNLGQIKTGSLSRTERIAKYNQLLRIEEEIASKD